MSIFFLFCAEIPEADFALEKSPIRMHNLMFLQIVKMFEFSIALAKDTFKLL